jgi:hypothetical protein
MPGIFGILQAKRGVVLEEASARAKLGKMQKALAHRGDYRSLGWDAPDKTGYTGSIGHANLMEMRDRQPGPDGFARTPGLFYGPINSGQASATSRSALSDFAVERLSQLSGCFSLLRARKSSLCDRGGPARI